MEDLPETFRTSGATEIRKRLQEISGGKVIAENKRVIMTKTS
jgi:hypothetical protein